MSGWLGEWLEMRGEKVKNYTKRECVREFMNGSLNEFRQRDSVSPDGY